VPELLEVESYRRLADRTVGRRIRSIDTPDAWYLKGNTAEELKAAVVGTTVVATGRRGKLLTLTLGNGRILGLRFGMTGRLIVDGEAAIDELVYGARRQNPGWDRFTMRFGTRREPPGWLTMSDPRRLGGVELDPDIERLGPDAATISRPQLMEALRSAAPVKAALMDQGRIAGLGNLLTDDVLWRAGLAPARSSNSITGDELATLHRAVRATLRVLARRGGSHTGDLQDERSRGGHCPRDGAPLRRDQIGGRTTIWCPVHQR